MRVALVIPTHLYQGEYPTFLALSDFPVGFAYLAAALKKAGHDVIGLNPNNCPGYPSVRSMLYDKMEHMIREQCPELIGIGGLCSDFAFIRDAIAMARSLAPSVPIVCGGGIVTHDAEFILNHLKPDYGIIGEAEEVLVLLTNSLATGCIPLEDIPNLGYWHNGEAVFTATDYSYPPLATRPFPDYSPFDPEIMIANSATAARSLFRFSRPEPRILPFVTARGCPFKCTFCVHNHGPAYRARPMSDILAEIGDLYNSYQFNILLILDELFAIDKQRLQEFCDGIREGRGKYGWDFDWQFQTHPTAKLGRNDLIMAKEAGCIFFSYGIESASPQVLESMKKNPDRSKF
jgi:anaerobic magnesium-protoporphyrin IX monomethyl ester cyclase